MSRNEKPYDLTPVVEQVISFLHTKPTAYLIAVVGIPGSGKSTFSHVLSARLPGSIVLPMDGYHLPKGGLTQEQLARRGAPHTFDSETFRRDLINLRNHRTGSFPSFHHEKKDPVPNDIKVERDHSPVIVEGNYLLLQAWGLADLFDFKIFVDCDIDVAMDRVRERLFECKIVPTRETAAHQVESNDRLNARLIIEDGAERLADMTIRSDG